LQYLNGIDQIQAGRGPVVLRRLIGGRLQFAAVKRIVAMMPINRYIDTFGLHTWFGLREA